MSKVVCAVLCWRFLAGQRSTVGRPAEVDSDQIETFRTIDMGDSQHTQNIQINKVIGENEKNVSFCNSVSLEKAGDEKKKPKVELKMESVLPSSERRGSPRREIAGGNRSAPDWQKGACTERVWVKTLPCC